MNLFVQAWLEFGNEQGFQNFSNSQWVGNCDCSLFCLLFGCEILMVFIWLLEFYSYYTHSVLTRGIIFEYNMTHATLGSLDIEL